ncbi:MAG: zf-HC2 domain-containing protein [Acidobacteriota bacterium]
MDCPHWDELKFIKHCQGELPPQEEDQFQQHLHICTDCREYANISWEVMLNVPTTEESAEIERDTEAFLKSKTWQECKERLIKRHTQVPKKPRNTRDVKRPADTGINPNININSLLGIDLNARHDDVDTDTAIQIEKDTQEFLHSKEWKEHKQKLIQHLANNTLEQHVEERRRQRAEQVVEQQQPEHSEQPTVEMPAPTNVNVVAFPEEKLQAPKASRLQHQTIMKIAAMVIMVITPALLTYHLLVRPYYEKQAGRTSALATTIVETTDLKTIAEAFESANARLKEDSQDADALFVRAVSSEKLLLLEDAKSDYQSYLSIDDNSERRRDVAQRLSNLTQQLKDKPAVKQTRYQELDHHIDDYLAALQAKNSIGAANSLASAADVANEMAIKSGDMLGRDLVSFYRTVPYNAINSLVEARNLRTQVEAIKGIDRFTEALTKASTAKKIFETVKASTEAEISDIQIVKYLARSDELSRATALIEASLPNVTSRQHLFSRAQLLLWKGHVFSNTSNFNEAIASLEDSFNIAKELDIPKFTTLPAMLLSTIYHVTNDNEHAMTLAHKTFAEARLSDELPPAQIVQVLGASSFNLNYPLLAERYLDYSMTLAEKQKNYSYLVMSYNLSGILQAEQKRFNEAEERFSKAYQALTKIVDENARFRMEFAVTGYYARTQMLAGNIDRSISLYEKAIDLGERTNVQEMLALSQLHQGLGESWMAKGDLHRAETEMEKAIALDHQARARFEQNNMLLTFAVTRKSCQEQLHWIRSN